MKCNYCSTENTDDAKFCVNCGHKIENKSNSETSANNGGTNTVTSNSTHKPRPVAPLTQTHTATAAKNNIMTILIIVIILFVNVIIVVCIKNLISKERDDSSLLSNISDTVKEAVGEVSEKTTKEIVIVENSTEHEATLEGDYSIFEQMPSIFVFSSGVGGWDTTIELSPDGSFVGIYHDSNMGESGDGFDATIYICNFEGKFTAPIQINKHTYSTSLEYLNAERTEGTEITDRIRYIYTEPYGFDNSGDFLIYLPGAKVADLPDEFISWTMFGQDKKKIDYYGIYNVNAKEGFFSYDSNQSQDNPLQDDYVIEYSDSRLLTEDDIDGLTLQQINYAKNEIYARHGYIFESHELQEYFDSKQWYQPLYNKAEFNTMNLLSDLENKNAVFLSNIESSMGWYQLDK